MMHHLKKLSKIENNPNGYYTQQYRHLYGLYRQLNCNFHGGKARGRGRGRARLRCALIRVRFFLLDYRRWRRDDHENHPTASRRGGIGRGQ